MSNILFYFRRTVRRFGIFLLLIGIFATSAIGWVLDRASELVHICVNALGLAHLEDWLRGRSVWFAGFLMCTMFAASFVFKVYEVNLIYHDRIFLAVLLWFVFKIVWFGIMNYLLHLFGDQLLGVRVIAWGYGLYVRAKTFALERLRQSAIYQRASAIKRRIMAFARRRSLFGIAKRFGRTKKRDE